jgi:hypothetical protein
MQLSLCLINTYPREDTWGSACILFMSALVGDEWSDSRPGRFIPEERVRVSIG